MPPQTPQQNKQTPKQKQQKTSTPKNTKGISSLNDHRKEMGAVPLQATPNYPHCVAIQ